MPTERNASVPLLMLAPLGVREMPVAERLMVGLVRLIAPVPPGVTLRAPGSERPSPGVRLMLGPLRPVGDGVSLLVASPAPGCRVLGMLTLRSAVEPDGVRVIDCVPVPGRPDCDGVRLTPGAESRWTEPVPGVRVTDPLRPASLGERVIEGVVGLVRLTSDPLGRWICGPADRDRSGAADGVRETEGARLGDVNLESPAEGRLIWPSGRVIEGVPAERAAEGASRNLSSEPRSKVRFCGEIRSAVDGR